jgi:aerotaxis receptor
MRINLPVTQRELDYTADHMLVSVTDTKGIITHCNRAFVDVSGYSFDELIGQNHNLIRHPDMPAIGFKDLWSTIGRGKPWTGLVKNRAKSGDHYWVKANVSPIMVDGKPRAYLSVRIKPTRAEIEAADALYKAINDAPDPSALPVYLKEGVLYRKGVPGMLDKLRHLSFSARLGVALGFMTLLGLSPELLALPAGPIALAVRASTLLAGGALTLWWLHRSFAAAFGEAQRFANDLGGCNLSTSITTDYPPPMGTLIRSLQQIQINLRAVVGDVRHEISLFQRSADEIAAGGLDLQARTESQASSLEQTSGSMVELARTVEHTAATAQQVGVQSSRSNNVALQGGQAVHRVGAAMDAINQSSAKVREIIGVIEGIAFQTNILALNAAVEAARAGEQGRGFAVVAAEVRALAQRSAVAAKEIRELIARSTEQIAESTVQMGSAAKTIDEVVHSVQEVGQLIAQITKATHAQASGIEQVNSAVTALETVTQQNAALVEESAASAEGLRTSGTMLTRAAQVFHLPQ